MDLVFLGQCLDLGAGAGCCCSWLEKMAGIGSCNGLGSECVMLCVSKKQLHFCGNIGFEQYDHQNESVTVE